MGGLEFSIFQNDHVVCPCRYILPMSHVEFKKCSCRMSIHIHYFVPVVSLRIDVTCKI